MLKKDLDFYKKKFYEEQSKVSRLTAFLNSKFNWFIDLLAENKSPCLKYLLKEIKDLKAW
jgi:hypothetical protein